MDPVSTAVLLVGCCSVAGCGCAAVDPEVTAKSGQSYQVDNEQRPSNFTANSLEIRDPIVQPGLETFTHGASVAFRTLVSLLGCTYVGEHGSSPHCITRDDYMATPSSLTAQFFQQVSCITDHEATSTASHTHHRLLSHEFHPCLTPEEDSSFGFNTNALSSRLPSGCLSSETEHSYALNHNALPDLQLDGNINESFKSRPHNLSSNVTKDIGDNALVSEDKANSMILHSQRYMVDERHGSMDTCCRTHGKQDSISLPISIDSVTVKSSGSSGPTYRCHPKPTTEYNVYYDEPPFFKNVSSLHQGVSPPHSPTHFIQHRPMTRTLTSPPCITDVSCSKGYQNSRELPGFLSSTTATLVSTLVLLGPFGFRSSRSMVHERGDDDTVQKPKLTSQGNRKSSYTRLRTRRSTVDDTKIKTNASHDTKDGECRQNGDTENTSSPGPKRRSILGNGTPSSGRLSRQRFLEALNAMALFCVVRKLHMRQRKPAIPSQRNRLFSHHQGSMFCKPYSVGFPPGALPENLVVWIRCVENMPLQPKSVSHCNPWHLGRISYCKPAPGFLLGYLHQSGVPEDLKSYLIEWALTGHCSDSATNTSKDVHHLNEHFLSATSPSSFISQCVDSSSTVPENYFHKEKSDDEMPHGDPESIDRHTENSAISHKRTSQDSTASFYYRLALDPSLRLEFLTGIQDSHSLPSYPVAACAPWQFLYYVHYQGYNRRYDRWVNIDELRPVIIDPHTNRVSSAALARHYVSALHSLGHPKWRNYVVEMKNYVSNNCSSTDVKPQLKDALLGEVSFHQAALLALRLLCSVVHLCENGHEVNRGRRDVIPLLEWCCVFLGSVNREGPPIIDAMELYIAAFRANKQRKKSNSTSASRQTLNSTLMESEVVWNPLCNVWTAAIESLEHGRGISLTLLNDKSRSLVNTWETMILPSRSRDNMKPATVNLFLTLIETTVDCVLKHRATSADRSLVFSRNYSCVDQFDDVHSDAGEHEGIDPTSIEAHESMTKIRTIDTLQIDNFIVSTWYYSPFPLRFHPAERVYICGGCLSYFFSQVELRRHEQLCTRFYPPGHEIYRDGRLSFFQVDGEFQSQYCENLSLISKLFLDHKTLQYSVTPFLFYILIEWDESNNDDSSNGLLQRAGMISAKKGQFIGYFSKEKVSSMGYNLACILTLPQHQRKGYGKYFMQFSYCLSKIEGKSGTPERPLSDLGRLSYTQYWKQTLLTLLLTTTDKQPSCSCLFAYPLRHLLEQEVNQRSTFTPPCSTFKRLIDLYEAKVDAKKKQPQYIGDLPLTIDDVSHFTALRHDDIVYVLYSMKLIQKSEATNNYILCFDATQWEKELRSCGKPPRQIEANQFLVVPGMSSSCASVNDVSLTLGTSHSWSPHGDTLPSDLLKRS